MFWQTFKKLCESVGTSPNAVCANIGLSTAAATYWKNGSIPKGDALVKVADYFNVSVDYLLGRENTGGTTLHYSSNDKVNSIVKDLLNTDVADGDLDVIRAILNKY